jgi:hypothetical protein
LSEGFGEKKKEENKFVIRYSFFLILIVLVTVAFFCDENL